MAADAAPECDLLVRNAYVITLDEQRRVYPSGAVAISGRRIVAVGPDAEVGRLLPARGPSTRAAAPFIPGMSKRTRT